MPGSIHLGKIAGITLNINFSWLIIFTLLAASLAVGWFPLLVPGLAGWGYWGLGIVGALLLFVSILIHELAHSFAAKAHGLGVSDITLSISLVVSRICERSRVVPARSS